MFPKKRALMSCMMAIAASGVTSAGIWDRPKPKVYAHKADQHLARLFDKPCAEADAGRGCIRNNNRLRRKYPCADHGDGTVMHRPTDQCYKMEKPRRFRGIWINNFEGQRFIPDGMTPPEWPRTDPKTPGWREQADRAQAARIWIDVHRVDLTSFKVAGGQNMHIEFIGRKTRYPGNYGHMGMSGNEIIVDRVIALKTVE